MNINLLLNLVNMWTDFFNDSIKTALVSENCVLSESSCTVLFGSNVTDLLECYLDWELSMWAITQEGLCYVKGK
jgi:hypothetical protein